MEIINTMIQAQLQQCAGVSFGQLTNGLKNTTVVELMVKRAAITASFVELHKAFVDYISLVTTAKKLMKH